MSHARKTLAQVLDGTRDASVRFDALRALVLVLGFAERTNGSHHVFTKSGVRDILNLQRDGRNAKPYQVRQVRRVIGTYHLTLRG